MNDFTETNYKNILQNAITRYSFIGYEDIKQISDNKEYILWRHDVDFSIHRSYALAKIEKELDVKATYFLQLGAEFYNLFEQEIKELIFKIRDFGHELGLHFDPTQYRINTKEDLEKYLLFEKNIIEKLFDIKVSVFSFHNPTENIMKFDDYQYAGMINTYAKYFKENIMYCSDSNGYWRHEKLEDFLSKKDYGNRQVLTHPGWWQKQSMSPFDRVKRCINGRVEKRLKTYEKNLKKYGRENVK